MTNTLKMLALTVCLFAFLVVAPQAGQADNVYPSIPVLLYHRVGYTNDPLTITPERFAKELAALKENGYETISIETFAEYMKGSTVSLPAKPVLITFDDGYQDNYSNAFPLLKKYNSVATFFVITYFVDKYEDRLTSGEIQEMHAAGMSFGSHTVTHNPLAKLNNEWAANELLYSRQFLEALLHSPICAIAYPRGSYTADTLRLAGESGYSLGFTVKPGSCAKTNPPFSIPRIPVFSYSGDTVAAIKRLAEN